VALHNFLRTEDLKLQPTQRTYTPPGYIDEGDTNNGEWRSGVSQGAFQDIGSTKKHNSTVSAKTMRENLAEYFLNEGKVEFQYERINNN